MKIRKIGATDIEASAIVFGGWAIGGGELGDADESEAVNALSAALDNGINFIDTAPIYGKGQSERLVGRVTSGQRDQVVIATKVGLRWDCADGDFSFEGSDGVSIYRNLRPESIRLEVERSLTNLGTDYIDLLQTHWPDSTTPIAETMGALLDLKAEGKIRAIGACNLTPKLLEEYQVSGAIDSLQEMYSMVDRTHEADLFPQAKAAHMSVLAYSPLAIGLLTGKIGPERVFPENDIRSWSPRFTVEVREQIVQLLAKFEPLAEKYEVSMAQLVIAWTVAQPCLSHVLCGARNPKQAAENAVGGRLEIKLADLKLMDTLLEAENITLPNPFGN
ncbi:MAG: aldo/keto reductase [Verrucomicrobiota bacterium]